MTKKQLWSRFNSQFDMNCAEIISIMWRDEEKDLIKTFAFFQESFKSLRLQVKKKPTEGILKKREININDVEQMLHCI